MTHGGKTHAVDAKFKGESVRVVSAFAVTCVIKNHLFVYMVFVQESNSMNEDATVSKKELYFKNNLLIASRMICLVIFHMSGQRIIVLILCRGISPPNKPPYRVSAV